LKRTIDIGIGGLLAIVSAPVIAVLALIGLGVWRANPFFVQERIGRGGDPYRVWKLRSLPVDAPAYADKYAIEAVPVPAFGQLLRRLHLDELPQIMHVVSGKMSLVGPRPEMGFLHAQMPRDFAEDRVSVRPGVTGLWQVSPALAGLIHEAPEYDRTYLALRNVRLDAYILYRTGLKVLGAPPVTLDQLPAWVRPRSIRLADVSDRPETPVRQVA
jgi:lipopolysaccharide/colanic/teichoic acid biosynthesis glycosyltransferase